MEGSERLLLTLAMAVHHMRQAQTAAREYPTDKNVRAAEACEREVDALIALHLTPSPIKPTTGGGLFDA